MLKKINELLKTKEFISVGTCDLKGRPNAAPKFLLKVENNVIYLIDYTRGRTWDNLKINPRASLSFMDTDNLTGYQINGSTQVIDKGPIFEEIFSELLKKQIDLSAMRIIEGVSHEKGHKNFELAIPEKVIIFMVSIEEIIEVGPRGEKKAQKVKI